MATKSLFPEDMIKSSEFSIESVAGKLLYFQEQIHLLHWITANEAEHLALGGMYEYIQDFRDDVTEKLMGYTNRKIRGFKMDSVSEGVVSSTIISDLIIFAHELKNWARMNDYDDVENLSQSLSGEAAKVRYKLTQS
jgi:hypothetical protein